CVQRTKMSDKNASSTIYRENNNIKIRSRTNFVKNSSDSFSTKENPNIEINNKIEEQGGETLKTEVALGKKNNLTCNTSINPYNSNGFLGSGKYLFEVLDHLTDEMCSQIRTRCGKNYTDKAIREIAKAVSRSKKGAKAFFYHIKGFIAYLSKILTFEKRDPVKISSTNYYITANQTEGEKEMREQEKYLTGIEYSLEVSPEWHLKKRLAAMLERSRAYNILTSWKSLEITKEGVAKLSLAKPVFLTEIDKKIILSQVKSTHDGAGVTRGSATENNEANTLFVDSLELETPKDLNQKTQHLHYQAEETLKREGVWGKIRETFASYFGSEGDAIDKSWLSNFNASIDNRKKTIELQAPSRFIKDWVESNYLGYIEDAARVNGLEVQGIK
ncbi:DnaA N-terminal domain-containing protein, partial [Rickettsiaceae bacterium]|nr:DnaA N-terminal domain-containing protein [Rickettsiaceae bacterium]